MNCNRLWPNIRRILLAVVISVLLVFFFIKDSTWFQVFVVYALNYIGLSIWDIGKELNDRLKALHAYLEDDLEMEDDDGIHSFLG